MTLYGKPKVRAVLIAASIALGAFSALSCATPAARGDYDPALGRATITERRVAASAVSRVRDIDYVSDRVPPSLEGYRVLFVSDIHFMNRFSQKRLDALMTEINAQEADCVILGGDLTLSAGNLAEFAASAGTLRAKEGVYAVLGNHDFFNGRQKFVASLRTVGIVTLDETTIITPRGLALSGINDFRDVFPVMKPFLDTVPEGDFTILASHDPDFMEKAPIADLSRFDLVLSGHTHGGQITFFGWAPILPSEYGQRYRTGTVFKDGVPIIVSNGAGYSGERFRFRFCAPSDYLLITLRRPDPTKAR
jgi:predicted MPP superfamily phosphohydrolase